MHSIQINIALLLAQSDSAGIFTYFSQSNLAGKIIILLLAVFSILAWSVMLGKYFDLNRLRSLNLHTERQISELENVLEYTPDKRVHCPYNSILNATLYANNQFQGRDKDIRTHMGHIENAIQRAVSNSTIQYESKMVLLGSIVTAAPFIGLLGTVWGVMDAFGSMGMDSAATIKALAPGVSGALLTTVAGLLVAIPSVLGYNFLLTKTKIMITELENFASRLADRIEIEMQ